MAGLNKAQIIGNVGKDPEIRTAADGRKVATFSIATSETWTDKTSGEKKENTEWHRIVCFNEKLSEIVEKYVKKGSKVYVEGALKTRKWTDNNGIEKYTTEIVLSAYRGEIQLLDSKDRSGSFPPAPSEDEYGTTKDVSPANQELLDDEIPF